MTGIRTWAERYFEFEALGTDWRTEVLAGLTTFMTMAYIIFVNPAILHDAGIPVGAAVIATCVAAAFGSMLMGLFARYPIALAPGMGLNAYFAYSVVKGMGVKWEVALGAVFLSGVAFLVLTAVGVRQMILKVIPQELYSAVACGVGLFIALIGLRNAGIVIPDATTMVTLGNLRQPSTVLGICNLVLISALLAWRVKAAILIGILATSVAGWSVGLIHSQPQLLSFRDVGATAFHLDVSGAIHLGFLEIVFVFLFVDLFDNVGTLVAVGQKAGLFQGSGDVPRLNRILFADASATIFGSMAGTSTVVSYIESSAGVAAGGRSGVTAIVTGLLFLAALAVVPLGGAIPAAATAPALVIVGSMMMTAVSDIEWNEPAVAVSAFLTMIMIPLTYSIANGLAFGLTAYTLIRVLRGQFREVNWFVWLLTALFLLRFFYISHH